MSLFKAIMKSKYSLKLEKLSVLRLKVGLRQQEWEHMWFHI